MEDILLPLLILAAGLLPLLAGAWKKSRDAARHAERRQRREARRRFAPATADEEGWDEEEEETGDGLPVLETVQAPPPAGDAPPPAPDAGRARPVRDAYALRGATRPRFRVDRSELRRAVLLSEIFGPPVSLRRRGPGRAR